MKNTYNTLDSIPCSSSCSNCERCICGAVWCHVDVGVLFLDTHQRQMVRLSDAGKQVLERVGIDIEYDALVDFFELTSAGFVKDSRSGTARSVAISGRVIGFTIHITVGGNVCVFFNDITEKKHLEVIAEEANLMENIGYVFAGIRHELGNPINSIKTSLTVLERSWRQLPPEKVGQLLGNMVNNIGRVEYLLKGLRGFSLFDELDTEPVELQDFIRGFLELASAELSSRGIVVTAPLEEQQSEWVWAHSSALHQVALNLLSNSFDALEDQSEPRIDIKLSCESGFTILSFSDNGCGIPEEQKSTLFKPFHTTKAHGNGLGLVITKRLVTSMNGQIGISSLNGEGATVTIALQRAHALAGI